MPYNPEEIAKSIPDDSTSGDLPASLAGCEIKEVSNVDEIIKLCRSTKWYLNNRPNAENYLKELGGSIKFAFKDGTPVAAFNGEKWYDRWDKPIY